MENLDRYYPRLRGWLADIPASEIHSLVLRQFEVNEVLVHKDQLFQQIFIVLDGICNVINQLDNGTEIITLRLSSGDLIGVSESVLGGMRYIASVKSCTTLVAAEMEAATFRRWLESYPCFVDFVLKNLVTRLHYTADLSANCQSSASKINLAKYFMDRCSFELSSVTQGSGREIIIQETHEMIGNFLGINTRTVERHIRALKQQGLINTVRGKVSISPAQYQELLHYVTSNL